MIGIAGRRCQEGHVRLFPFERDAVEGQYFPIVAVIFDAAVSAAGLLLLMLMQLHLHVDQYMGSLSSDFQ